MKLAPQSVDRRSFFNSSYDEERPRLNTNLALLYQIA